MLEMRFLLGSIVLLYCCTSNVEGWRKTRRRGGVDVLRLKAWSCPYKFGADKTYGICVKLILCIHPTILLYREYISNHSVESALFLRICVVLHHAQLVRYRYFRIDRDNHLNGLISSMYVMILLRR